MGRIEVEGVRCAMNQIKIGKASGSSGVTLKCLRLVRISF